MTKQHFPPRSHPPQERLGLPPVPPSTFHLLQATHFQQDPLAFLRAVRQEYSDIACLLLPEPVVLVIHPEYVQQVLQGSFLTYHKAESSP